MEDSGVQQTWPLALSENSPPGDPWTGLNDRTGEGEWKWDADQSTPTFTYWYKGQPAGGTSENCGGLYSDGGRWWDYHCTAQMPFWCMKE